MKAEESQAVAILNKFNFCRLPTASLSPVEGPCRQCPTPGRARLRTVEGLACEQAGGSGLGPVCSHSL